MGRAWRQVKLRYSTTQHGISCNGLGYGNQVPENTPIGHLSLQIMETRIKCNMSIFLERLGLVLISCCARDTSLARRPCCLGHQVSHSTSCCLSGSVFEAPLYYSVTGVFFLQTCSHPTTVTPELRNSRWYQVSG
jgi:hypothetical protein